MRRPHSFMLSNAINARQVGGFFLIQNNCFVNPFWALISVYWNWCVQGRLFASLDQDASIVLLLRMMPLLAVWRPTFLLLYLSMYPFRIKNFFLGSRWSCWSLFEGLWITKSRSVFLIKFAWGRLKLPHGWAWFRVIHLVETVGKFLLST